MQCLLRLNTKVIFGLRPSEKQKYDLMIQTQLYEADVGQIHQHEKKSSLPLGDLSF